MTPEERTKLESIRHSVKVTLASKDENPAMELFRDFEFVLDLLDREQGVTDLSARISKVKELNKMHRRLADELVTLRVDNAQKTHAVRLLQLFRPLFRQIYGLKNAWAGRARTCGKCSNTYYHGANWMTEEFQCPYCLAAEAAKQFNNWREQYDQKNEFSEF